MNGVIENGLVSVDANTVAFTETQPNRRRRKKSIVWEYFTVVPISPDCSRACCNQCKKSFAYIKGSKQAGTSHLKRHIDLGICPVNRPSQDKIHLMSYNPVTQNGTVMASPRKRCRASPGSVTIALDREHCISEIAKMIILNGYPINMVEQPGFINFMQSLQPHFSNVSSETIQSEIVSVYSSEKQVLAELLSEIPGRVSITMDFWTSDQGVGYAILTGHFVDADWRLQRRVLNFVEVPYPEYEVAFNHAIVSCLSKWGLESKLFALTLDRSFANEAMVGNIRGLLSINNSHMLNGRFLIGDCFACIMRCLALEVLDATKEEVCKVRDCIKFVKMSESSQDKCKQQWINSLVLDNKGKWDTTYHMLSKACEFKGLFSGLDSFSPDYKTPPSLEDWDRIEVLCAYLKLLLEACDVLTSETYPSSNTFFHEAFKIHMQLAHRPMGEDPFITNLVGHLYQKFDTYWRNWCVVLAVAVAMDPRFKLKVVEFSFTKIFGEEAGMWIRAVDEAIHELYFEYVAHTLPLPCIHVEERFEGFDKEELDYDESALPPSDGFSDFDIYISEISSNHQSKSELDQYLDELLIPRESEKFDVFEWWKLNRIKYPILSKMAADILSIPMATVQRDSVFDTTNKKLDSNWGSLKPATLEAVICASNWLQCGVQNKSPIFDISIINELKDS